MSWALFLVGYFLSGLWFVVNGAALVSSEMFYQWLAVSFYQEIVLNLTLRIAVSGDDRLFPSDSLLVGGYPFFEVQSLFSVAAFLAFTRTETKFRWMLLAPVALTVLLTSLGDISVLNSLMSASVGSINGLLKAWIFSAVVSALIQPAQRRDTLIKRVFTSYELPCELSALQKKPLLDPGAVATM